MDRLTEKHYMAEDYYMKCSENCDLDIDCVDCHCSDAIVNKLGEYEDAEEQGLLVRLPCKVGDRIYMAFVSGEIRERTVTMISTLGGCEWAVHYGEPCEGCVGSNDFGEWVFLTREEAEAAQNNKGEG